MVGVREGSDESAGADASEGEGEGEGEANDKDVVKGKNEDAGGCEGDNKDEGTRCLSTSMRSKFSSAMYSHFISAGWATATTICQQGENRAR